MNVPHALPQLKIADVRDNRGKLHRIFVWPWRLYATLSASSEQTHYERDFNGEVVEFWELRRLMHDLRRCTIQAHMILWAPEENVVVYHEVWREVVAERTRFLGYGLAPRLIGTAQAQWDKWADSDDDSGIHYARDYFFLMGVLRDVIEYGTISYSPTEHRALDAIDSGEWTEDFIDDMLDESIDWTDAKYPMARAALKDTISIPEADALITAWRWELRDIDPQ